MFLLLKNKKAITKIILVFELANKKPFEKTENILVYFGSEKQL